MQIRVANATEQYLDLHITFDGLAALDAVEGQR
jgi:hypothetical protein